MIALSLGSNLGDRRANLQKACSLLSDNQFQIHCKSSIYESPAAVKENNAKDSWSLNFLNQVILGDCPYTAKELLGKIQNIEKQMGRDEKNNWSPRPIDIDILFFHEEEHSDEHLQLPHPALWDRYFILSPLYEIAHAQMPFFNKLQQAYKKLPIKNCQWLGIVNLSPDSFAEKDTNIEARIETALLDKPHILDIGAVSTRPGAALFSQEQEWSIFADFLPDIISEAKSQDIRISIDTQYPKTAEAAMEMGVDMINDISGLSNEMQDIARASDVDWVFMHNLGIPASKEIILNKEIPAVSQLQDWLDKKYEWIGKQNQPRRFIFDPGIGFGKDAAQSRNILAAIHELNTYDLKILIGHSRKSFLNGISQNSFAQRDLETISISMELIKKGVHYLRVHNVKDHRRALLALQGIF